MDEQTDYRIANKRKRELKLRHQRHDILKKDGEAALSAILDAPSPATLVQSFPDQDLYYLMNKIGPDDFTPILSMATSDQWEYILDVDVWENDRLDLSAMTRTFDLLFQADPHRLLRWAITQKPDFLEFYLFKNMSVFIREHDEPPPSDFDDYITLDDKFYFRFPDKPESAPLPDDDQVLVSKTDRDPGELIETMLKTLADMDLSVFHGLLLETSALLPAETEEEQFRLKNIRLAEKGFLPAHEAVGIYQPVGRSSLGKRPESLDFDHENFDPDLPLPPQFFAGFMEGDNLFIKSVQLFDSKAALVLESELAALINKVISADKVRLRSKKDLESVIAKTCSYLNLGLEILLNGEQSPASAKAVIQDHFLENIFRTGSREGIRLKTRAEKWFSQSFMHKNNLPLSFLDEWYLGVIGGLLIDRPLFFDQAAPGERYRNFKTTADIKKTAEVIDQIIALDHILSRLEVDISSFTSGMLTYKTLILTLWAKNRLKLDHTLEPIPVRSFRPFFAALFASDDSDKAGASPFSDLLIFVEQATGLSSQDITDAGSVVIHNLIKELEDEYAKVDPRDLDPRFIPHFLLKTDKTP